MKKLSEIIPASEVVEIIGNVDITIESLIFDSRLAGANRLFFAQKGSRVDGHQFINQVIEAGCNAVVCEVFPADISSGVTFVKVKDASKALGLMASAFYDFPSRKLKLVGVTGTNGKTTTATLLYRLFRFLGYKTGLFSTVVNYIDDEVIPSTHTTPDAVALNQLLAKMVAHGCEYVFMEVSSHSVDQHRITGLEFAGAGFTNLTHDHLDYHLTFDAYLKAKKTFFDNLSKDAFALVNADDKNGMVMLQNCKATKKTYSIRAMADYKARIIESLFEGMLIEFDGVELWTPFVGKFNAQNLLCVYGIAIQLGISKDEVLLQMSKLVPVDGRFETIRSANGITAVVDYAHTPDAIRNVIDAINQIREEGQQLITVVGAGGDRDKTKRPVMAKEALNGSTKVILTSDNPRSEEPAVIIEEMMQGVEFAQRLRVLSILDRKEAIKTACMIAHPGDIILIAGKGHETYQEVKGVKHHFDDREIVREIFQVNS